MSCPPPTSPLWAGACWPVPIWKGTAPVISDGFKRHAVKDPKTGKQKSRQHLGVDIMFRNKAAQKPKVPTVTAWHHMPSGEVPMLAMLAGTVWSAEKTPRGFTVKIDHGARYGAPLVSYYTHMSKLLVKKGDPVTAGSVLGYIGNDPMSENDPNHAHVELWDYSSGEDDRVHIAVDLGPYLKRWQKLTGRPGSVPGRFVIASG